jgi:hypothetical protein
MSKKNCQYVTFSGSSLLHFGLIETRDEKASEDGLESTTSGFID